MALSLKKNFLWTFWGQGFFSFCQWMALVLIAKLTNPEEVGQYSLAFGITAPIVLFSGMNLRIALASDAQNDYSFGDYLGLRLLTCVVVFIIVIIILLCIKASLFFVMVLLFVTCNKLLEDISTIFHGKFQQQEQMDIISKSLTLRGFFGLAVFGAVLWGTHSILYAIITRTGVSLMSLLFYDVTMVKSFVEPLPVFKCERLLRLLIKSYPLGIVMGIMSLRGNLPRYFLAHYQSVEVVGYYSAISLIMLFFHLPVHAVAEVAIARLSKYYVHEMRNYIKLFVKMFIMMFFVGMVVVLLCWLFGKLLLTVVYSEDYAKYSRILTISAIGAGFAFFVSIGSSAFVATRNFIWQMVIYMIVLVASLGACAFMIPRWGIDGAAWAQVVSYAVHSIVFCGGVYISILKKMRSQEQPRKLKDSYERSLV